MIYKCSALIRLSVLVSTLFLNLSVFGETVPTLFFDSFNQLDQWVEASGGEKVLSKNDANARHAPYLKINNSLLRYELGFPLQQNFELKAKVKHTSHQAALWIGFFDQAGQKGYAASWDSSDSDKFDGNGFLNIRKHDHPAELLDWKTDGDSISNNVAGLQNIDSPGFAEISLKWERHSGTLTLSMNGKVLTQTQDKTHTSFSRIYLKANTWCHFDDVTLTTGQDSKYVTVNQLFNQGSLHTGEKMEGTPLNKHRWKTLNGQVTEQQDAEERVAAFHRDHSSAQMPLPNQGTARDYPLVTISYDIRRTSTQGNSGGVFLVDEKGKGIGFLTELADGNLNRSTLRLVATSDAGKTYRPLQHKTWPNVTGTKFHSVSFTWDRNKHQLRAMIDREKVKTIGLLPPTDINGYTRLILTNDFSNTLRMDNLRMIRIPSGAKNILDFGAIPDGAGNSPTNNQPALVATVAAAKQENVPVYVPAGVFAYDDVLQLDGVTMIGGGSNSILQSLNPDKSALRLSGDSPALIGCHLQGIATARSSQPHTAGAWIFHAKQFIVSANRISAMGSVGVFAFRSSQGTICGNLVSRTLADGIHHTSDSSHIQVINNSIIAPADDQIAVVSYKGAPHSHDIEAIHNYAYGQPHGRGLTVVGGKRITYARNQTSQAHQAGIYVNAETSYNTWDWEDIVIAENVIRDAGMSHIDDIADNEAFQGGLFISANAKSPSMRITANRNQIYHSHYRGIAIGSSCRDITIENNLIDTSATAALHLTAPSNVTLSNNVIRNAGNYGLYAGANSAGYLNVNNNLFVNVNANNKETFIDVMLIQATSTLESLKITNNRHKNPAGYSIHHLIENHFPASLSTLKNNTSTTKAGTWQAR